MVEKPTDLNGVRVVETVTHTSPRQFSLCLSKTMDLTLSSPLLRNLHLRVFDLDFLPLVQSCAAYLVELSIIFEVHDTNHTVTVNQISQLFHNFVELH